MFVVSSPFHIESVACSSDDVDNNNINSSSSNNDDDGDVSGATCSKRNKQILLTMQFSSLPADNCPHEALASSPAQWASSALPLTSLLTNRVFFSVLLARQLTFLLCGASFPRLHHRTRFPHKRFGEHRTG